MTGMQSLKELEDYLVFIDTDRCVFKNQVNRLGKIREHIGSLYDMCWYDDINEFITDEYQDTDSFIFRTVSVINQILTQASVETGCYDMYESKNSKIYEEAILLFLMDIERELDDIE